jgi:hypothetical protein
MTGDQPTEAKRDERSLIPPQAAETALFVTASELQDRKSKRRRDRQFSRSEAMRQFVEIGLKAKSK